MDFVLVQEDDTKQICQQFMKHHIANCMEAVVKDVRVRLNVQRAVFKGWWLTSFIYRQKILARDLIEALLAFASVVPLCWV